jgi:hypothetical protein
MKRKKWLVRATLVLLVLVAADFAADGVLRISRVKRAITARLETAFGRPVEVDRYDLRLFPRPALEARGMNVGEDPAFGYEYFLRAERATFGLRWSGLLRGRFEFGTFSFTRPSLNLVRDSSGRWNLDRWLPPARRGGGASASSSSAVVGPLPLPAAPVRLDWVEFDDGRINFKKEDDKLPFAFTGLSGKVGQIAPGRWTLSLEARPWRSGTVLQAAGTLFVRGDIAGTSARLQPAEIRLHWAEASLADLARLVFGEDFGLRGAVTVDGVARSGGGEWTFHVEGRARRIHRWDLTERPENPSVNLLCDGRWNMVLNEVRIAPISLEAPHSNARGEAFYSLGTPSSLEIQVSFAGIQAADILAWYRGFHAGVAEELSAEGYLSGAATLKGWPLRLQDTSFSSRGGTLRVPGLKQPVRMGAIEGRRTRKRLTLEPFSITLGTSPRADLAALTKNVALVREGGRSTLMPPNTAVAAGTHDLDSHSGWLSFEGRVDRAENVLAVAAAFGRPLERGWEGKGAATGALRWAWLGSPRNAKLSGHLDLSKAELEVAGLNLPVAVNEAQLIWTDGKRGARITSIRAFGAEWSGDIEEDGQLPAKGAPESAPGWRFKLHADHVDAAEFDRWTGPRARPGWLDGLLQSLLGNAPQAAKGKVSGSELIRRIRAEGEIRADELKVERLLLRNVKAKAALHALHLVVPEATAEYAGGTIRGKLDADFSPKPHYAVDARLERVQIAELLAAEGPPDGPRGPWEGQAWGELHLTTEGVGREELLRGLEGRGRVKMRGVSLRGWDVSASFRKGSPQDGASLWPAGEGEFSIRQGAVAFRPLRLSSGSEKTFLRGTVSFAGSADLELGAAPEKKRPSARVLKITGPIEFPKVSMGRAN